MEACAACRAALGEWSGRLAAAAAAVRESVPSEPIEAEARAWARLRRAMRPAAGEHLCFEDLLLYLDEEASAERRSHLERCAVCRAEASRLRLMLGEIEHELRSLIPIETAEQRAAARAELRRRMRPAAQVVMFPTRKRFVRAAVAAAAALIGLSALWTVDRATAPNSPTATAPVRPSVAEPARVDVEPPVETAMAPRQFPATEVPTPVSETAADRNVALDRFEPARIPQAAPRPAIVADLPPALPTVVNFAAAPAWRVPLWPPAPSAPSSSPADMSQSAQGRTPAQSAAAVQGAWLLIRAGVWRRDLEASEADGRLLFRGFVDDEADRERLIAALSKAEAGDGAPLAWDLRVRNEAAPAPAREIRAMDRPAGGYVRTALLQHYRDAARRSFQTPELGLLESEIARFASEMFTHQSGLLRHAYGAARLAAAARPALDAGIASVRKPYRKALEFHLDGLERHEAAIYDHLSEALPRKFWNPKSAAEPDPAKIGDPAALLADAIRLEEDLTNRLTGDPTGVGAEQAGATPGELLERVRHHADSLRKSLRALQ